MGLALNPEMSQASSRIEKLQDEIMSLKYKLLLDELVLILKHRISMFSDQNFAILNPGKSILQYRGISVV